MVHCDERVHYGNRAALPILLLAIHYKKRDAMQHLFFCAVLVEPSLKTLNSKHYIISRVSLLPDCLQRVSEAECRVLQHYPQQ